MDATRADLGSTAWGMALALFLACGACRSADASPALSWRLHGAWSVDGETTQVEGRWVVAEVGGGWRVGQLFGPSLTGGRADVDVRLVRADVGAPIAWRLGEDGRVAFRLGSRVDPDAERILRDLAALPLAPTGPAPAVDGRLGDRHGAWRFRFEADGDGAVLGRCLAPAEVPSLREGLTCEDAPSRWAVDARGLVDADVRFGLRAASAWAWGERALDVRLGLDDREDGWLVGAPDGWLARVEAWGPDAWVDRPRRTSPLRTVGAAVARLRRPAAARAVGDALAAHPELTAGLVEVIRAEPALAPDGVDALAVAATEPALAALADIAADPRWPEDLRAHAAHLIAVTAPGR